MPKPKATTRVIATPTADEQTVASLIASRALPETKTRKTTVSLTTDAIDALDEMVFALKKTGRRQTVSGLIVAAVLELKKSSTPEIAAIVDGIVPEPDP